MFILTEDKTMTVTVIQRVDQQGQRDELNATLNRYWDFLEHGGALTIVWVGPEELGL